MLIPKRHTGQTSPTVSERRKHPRLNGADLYVARLGWRNVSSVCCKVTDVIDSDPPIVSKASTGSLHDELLDPCPTPKSAHNLNTMISGNEPCALSSRPCYRCVLYMNSVGIKRVFWTTDSGAWEGAKVRHLMDAMEDLASGEAADTATILSSVFVTKHEVLMLRRMSADR
jgi:hypothetical protein